MEWAQFHLGTRQAWQGKPWLNLVSCSSTSTSSNGCFFLLVGKISPNFNLKKKFSTHTNDFSWKKKRPKFAKFQRRIKPKSPDFNDKFQQVAKKYRRILVFIFPLLSYLVYSQIWLNHLPDDHHFSYITKLHPKKKKETLVTINV